MPGGCEVCGKVYCDHSRAERQLTDKEWEWQMDRVLTEEELKAWESGDPEAKIKAARLARERIIGRPFVPSET